MFHYIKLKFAKYSLNMFRISQRLISFSIVTNKMAHSSRYVKLDPIINFHPVVGLKDIKLGTILLNQPTNKNLLTTQMMGQLFRFINSYHHDHTVENVWIQNRGQMFMGGISYQDLKSNPQYLDKLYKLTVMIAKLNKPIFSFVRGGVRNVGAYVLSMASVALSDCKASMRIDQVQKGFIPVGGGSHRLSRLPLKLGYYLALTNLKLDTNQMSRLGLITGIVKQGVTSSEMRQKIAKSNLFFRDLVRINTFDQRLQQWQQWDNILNKKQKLSQQVWINQQSILKSQENIFAKLAMNQYKLAKIFYQNATKPYNSFSDKPGRHVNNYFMMRHSKAFKFLQKEGLIQKSHFDDVRLPKFQLDQILKFFDKDSLLSVVKSLENEKTDQSEFILSKIRSMDPLAASLTFQLLKKAEELSWDQCLDLEYTIAKRLLKNSRLSLEKTDSGSNYVLVNDYSEGRLEDIPRKVIDEYICLTKNQDETLEREVQLYSLLPNVDHKNIPDSPRLALNRQFFDDIHLFNQEIQMKRWLEEIRIDYRNKSYDINSLRQKINLIQECQSIKSIESKRLQFIINNSRVLNKFIQERLDYVEKMSNQELQCLLDQTIKTVMNDGIRSRFEQFQKTAAVIGKQKKLQIFKDYRKYLIQKIVLNGQSIQKDNYLKNQFFKGPLFFPRDNQNVFNTINPNLQLHPPLKKLTQQFAANGQISQQFAQNQGSLLKDRHLGLDTSSTKRQEWAKKIKQKISKRYQQDPDAWQKASIYQQLVKEAANTSLELAEYLPWDTKAYYDTIKYAPQTPETYAKLGQKYASKFKKQRKNEIKTLSSEHLLFEVFSKEFFENIYQTSQPKTYSSQAFIMQVLVSDLKLSKQLQKFMKPILEQILRHFEEKYYQQALEQKSLQFGEFDRYIYEGRDKEFIKFYKNDIFFVYSYFAILKIKDVLHQLNQQIQKTPEQYIAFFKQFQIEFLPDQSIKSINATISSFLFRVLDVHTYTKAKIKLPQTKLLDFLNRIKIFNQTKKKHLGQLSFESLLLMIGKDRAKVYNKSLNEFLPTQPQFLLEAVHFLDDPNSKSNPNQIFYMYENAVSIEHFQKKRLISGYQYYLALFDSFIQKAAGKFNFVNDQILALDAKKIKNQLRNILNLAETPKEWLARCTQKAITNFFNIRLEFEKHLTKGELLAFDQDFRELLTAESFRLILRLALETEIQQTKQLFGQVRHYQCDKTNSDKQQQIYCEIRRNIKNPEAFKRLNNLKMAMTVQKQYFYDPKRKVKTLEQSQDLEEERREFSAYERFPKETYQRLSHEIYEYGEQRNFDCQLNPINQKQINRQNINCKLEFIEDEQKILQNKQQNFTDFKEEILNLRDILTRNSNDKKISETYKKLSQILQQNKQKKT